MKNYFKRTSLLSNYQGRFALVMIAAALVIVWVAVVLAKQPISPIPVAIQKAVSYPVYYPDPNRLPKGYSLNLKSIQLVNPKVVIFSLDGSHQQMIVFSEQASPGNATITRFESSYIPLHTTIWTPIGNAFSGAYNDGKTIKTLVSLPISGGPWLIITAPDNISHQALQQILNALIKS